MSFGRSAPAQYFARSGVGTFEKNNQIDVARRRCLLAVTVAPNSADRLFVSIQRMCVAYEWGMFRGRVPVIERAETSREQEDTFLGYTTTTEPTT